MKILRFVEIRHVWPPTHSQSADNHYVSKSCRFDSLGRGERQLEPLVLMKSWVSVTGTLNSRVLLPKTLKVTALAEIFATKRFIWNRGVKGKHHAHVTATRRLLNEDKENQESPCNATCMKAVVLMHRKFLYALNTAETGD